MNEQLRSSLHGWLGKSFHFDGRHLLVHELLDDQEILVLLSLDDELAIQKNQYGEPHRRAPETISVSLKTNESGELHPLIRFLSE